MKIRIELDDIPEFNKNLDILITLKKDGEGVVSGFVTTPSSSPRDFSRSTEKGDNTSILTVDGNGSVVDKPGSKNAKVESSLSSSVPIPSLESIPQESEPLKSKTKKTKDSKTKLSGNMMGIQF